MTIAAERIKLSTTRLPAWLALAATVLSLGLAAVQPSTAALAGNPLPPERAAIGMATFGVPVLMILAATTITSEYRTGTIRTTFMATPNRTKVLCAKAFLSAIIVGVSAAVIVIASIALARRLSNEQVGARLSLAEAATWRPVGAVALYAALGAVLAVALAVLLRHAAAVVALLLMVPFVVEPVLGSLPHVGERIGPFLPIVNAFRFTEVPWWYSGVLFWGPLGGLLYFCGVVVLTFLAAVLVINRRDP